MSAPVTTWSPQALIERLGPLAGGRVALATDADMIAGIQPAVVVEPATGEEIAALLAFANQERLVVLVRGGGTQQDYGYPPTGGDIVLSTRRLVNIVEYNPADLTVTVESGLPLAALQEELGQANQWLALDPALPATTIGGLVATAASGPRRLRYGGVRDQIIGVQIARTDGALAKGGGKVVKNVAGFDLPKLFTGSLGTLGVIVAASFRLYPRPADSRTVIISSPTPAPLCDLALRVTGSTLTASALTISGGSAGDTHHLAARFESLTAAAEDQVRALGELAGPLGARAEPLAGEEESGYWQRLAGGPATPEGQECLLRLKVSLLPSTVADWLDVVRAEAAASGAVATWQAHAGHGLLDLRLAGPTAALPAVVTALRAATAPHGSLVVSSAPPAFAAAFDVWGPQPALPVMRRIKAQFDPQGILNPGRFIGRI